MNERIDELMIEAGARFEFLHGVHYDDFQYKKFAELIVKDCCQFNYDFLESYREASEVNSKIRTHFGVK